MSRPARGGATIESAAQPPTSANPVLNLFLNTNCCSPFERGEWVGYDLWVLNAITRPDHGTGPHPHRTWLHLLAQDPGFLPSQASLLRARAVLLHHGLARETAEGGLGPGPEFSRHLMRRQLGGVPLIAAAPRGEVRVEAGIWRCYPDPGPQGFQSDPITSYVAGCSGCGRPVEFFRLRFPGVDPHQATCPHCGLEFGVLDLKWSPDLPQGQMEVTFGDLDQRSSLRDHPAFAELERALSTPLREVHVTL